MDNVRDTKSVVNTESENMSHKLLVSIISIATIDVKMCSSGGLRKGVGTPATFIRRVGTGGSSDKTICK